MASRVKTLFHRKKGEGVEEPPQRTRAPATARADPAFRTSLYESATAGGLPQTGDYPMKGNHSPVILQAGSRRSLSRGSQHNAPYQAPTPKQNDVARRTPHMSPSPSNSNNPASYDPYDPHQDTSPPMSGQDDRRNRAPRSALPQAFAGLNLGDESGPTTVTSTVTTTRFGQQGPNANRGIAQDQAGQNRDIGYGTASRNIEPQSPYANRGITQAQGYANNNNKSGYGANQGNQSSNSYANRNAPPNQGPLSQGRNAGYGPANLETTSPNSYGERGNTPAQVYGTQNDGHARTANNGDYQQAAPSSPYRGEVARTANNGDYQQSAPSNPYRGEVARTANNGDYQQSAPSNPYRGEVASNGGSGEPNTLDGQDGYQDLARQKSIPRKQVGTSAQAPYSSVQSSTSSSPQIGHSRQQSDSKPLPSAPISSNNGYGDRKTPATPQPISILDRSRPITKGYAAPRDGKDVVDRAKSNTYDTEVIEKIAPAVVHENVIKDVHHIREEVVTREVHTHDVYHRILPIVDIEVLPPRHFLPVEGGGLVEVSAAEVPGRGHNWVIAETASQIPSDQAAPQGRRQFTARQFPGQEGDTAKYMTPDGYEKTEETWVHPPELEDGARLTGQSWPMVFGDDNTSNATYANATPNQTNRKSPRKGQAAQASPAQRAGGFGRTAQSSIA